MIHPYGFARVFNGSVQQSVVPNPKITTIRGQLPTGQGLLCQFETEQVKFRVTANAQEILESRPRPVVFLLPFVYQGMLLPMPKRDSVQNRTHRFVRRCHSLNSPIPCVRIASSKTGLVPKITERHVCSAVGASKRRCSRVSIWRMECHFVLVLAEAV